MALPVTSPLTEGDVDRDALSVAHGVDGYHVADGALPHRGNEVGGGPNRRPAKGHDYIVDREAAIGRPGGDHVADHGPRVRCPP